MNIYVLGNEIDKADRLSLLLIKPLKKKFPRINFIRFDPTEELPEEEGRLVVIDTVVGINKVTIFNDLKAFGPAPQVGVHDYDLYLDLSLKQKLKKLSEFLILAVPMGYDLKKAAVEVAGVIKDSGF